MSASTSPAILAQKLKDVAIEQRRSGRTALNTFEFLQLVSLLHQQHAITQRLSIRADELEKWSSESWSEARAELRLYLDDLQRFQWTSSNLRRLPADAISDLTAKLQTQLDEPAYAGPFVDRLDAYADLSHSASSQVDVLRQLLFRWLPDRLVAPSAAHAMLRKHHRALGLEERVDDLPLGPSDINAFVDRLARFMVAVVGGAFLLVPIIVMSFLNSQNWRLVVSSIAVLAFSAFLSLLSQASNQEVLGGAAAYAAVMVVYVGSALSSNSNGSKVS